MMELFKVDDKTRENAYQQFNKTLKDVAEDANIISDWLKTQPHLPEIMDTPKIKNFLLLNKFNIEKTKKKIDMYYTIRTMFPDWFNSNPKLLKNKEKDEGYWVVHPHLFQGFYRVFIAVLDTPGNFNPVEAGKAFININEIRLTEDCMYQDILITDFSQFLFQDIMQFTPTIASTLTTIYQKVLSMRVKAAYFVNCPSSITIFLKIIKTVLPEKLFSRIHVSSDVFVLKETFDEDFLMKDYGGKGPSIKELKEAIYLKFDDYQDRFDVLDKLRVNETLRPKNLENDDHLGFYGNFKKLNVD